MSVICSIGKSSKKDPNYRQFKDTSDSFCKKVRNDVDKFKKAIQKGRAFDISSLKELMTEEELLKLLDEAQEHN